MQFYITLSNYGSSISTSDLLVIKFDLQEAGANGTNFNNYNLVGWNRLMYFPSLGIAYF